MTKMDRVGFEPTISALYCICKMAVDEGELNCSNPTWSTLFLSACSLACTIELSFEKKASQFNKSKISMPGCDISCLTRRKLELLRQDKLQKEEV
jgi:hypothetical protein